jgi:hypothetical protein
MSFVYTSDFEVRFLCAFWLKIEMLIYTQRKRERQKKYIAREKRDGEKKTREKEEIEIREGEGRERKKKKIY